MKLIQSSLFRAASSLVIGILLLKYPDNSVTWLTVAIGALFLVSGVVSLIAYWNANRHAGEYTITDADGNVISGTQPAFPIVGLGSVIFGLTLVVSPSLFVCWLMYILGAIIILGGINQLIALVNARRMASIGGYFWIAPILLLLTGVFVVVKPMESAELPMIILGWCMLVYGLSELVNTLMIFSVRRRLERQQRAMSQETEEVKE